MVESEGLLPYRRGDILKSTADDFSKVQVAWRHLEKRLLDAPSSVFNLSGLERGLPVAPQAIPDCDDEIAPALYGRELQRRALEHLGGNEADHDVFVPNRLTAALVAANLVLVRPGDRVIGVSARYSHPAVKRAAIRAGGSFEDVQGVAGLRRALADGPAPALVTLTRLSVSYELLPVEEIASIVAAARDVGARILVDDAGGARVGPAIFGQPRMLELGVDVGATGLDKYGTIGPRVGLLGGQADLVAKIRAVAFELGLEARPMLFPAVFRSLDQYDPARVRELVLTTKRAAEAIEKRIGAKYLRETPVTVQMPGESILTWLNDHDVSVDETLVPYELTAALAMLLLRDHGILTVHFAGIPPGTSALLLKFIPPETLERLGGPARLASLLLETLHALKEIATNRHAVCGLLLAMPSDEPSPCVE